MKYALLFLFLFLLASNSAFSIEVNSAALGVFSPVSAPTPNLTDAALIDLGRKLYYDKRLSKNQDISCNSCHKLDRFGVDGNPTSPGHRGQLGDRNSPTTYNSVLHFTQFWDGRAADLTEQAKGPVLNPKEMAMPSEASVVAVLNSIPEYVVLFKKAYPAEAQPLSYHNMAHAIAAFEKNLLTPSRFDLFLKGDQTALSDIEKQGLNKFLETGCQTCHMGPAVGGMMFQKLGLVEPWPNTKDQGRFAVTKNPADQMMFKVPSLRNIAMTAPYFHDGSIKTVEEAVRLMAKHQLGKNLAPADVALIVTFLKSLTGTIPTEYIKQPNMPVGSSQTPKPDPN